MVAARKTHYDYEDEPNDTPQSALQLYEDAKQGIEASHALTDDYVRATMKNLIDALAWADSTPLSAVTHEHFDALMATLVDSQTAISNMFHMLGQYRDLDANTRQALDTLTAHNQQVQDELHALLSHIKVGAWEKDKRFYPLVEVIRDEAASEFIEANFEMIEAGVEHFATMRQMPVGFDSQATSERLMEMLQLDYRPTNTEANLLADLIYEIARNEDLRDSGELVEEEDDEDFGV